MDKIQEVLYPRDTVDKAYANGYKAGQDSLKCCGCCLWCKEVEDYGIECINKNAGGYQGRQWLSNNCNQWETKE